MIDEAEVMPVRVLGSVILEIFATVFACSGDFVEFALCHFQKRFLIGFFPKVVPSLRLNLGLAPRLQARWVWRVVLDYPHSAALGDSIYVAFESFEVVLPLCVVIQPTLGLVGIESGVLAEVDRTVRVLQLALNFRGFCSYQ